MFSRKGNGAASAVRPRARSGASSLSLVGAEMTISGDVASEGALHVDGRIDGHVRCTNLCQSESGVISGNIVADEARVAGLVEGTVSARTVLIEANGRVAGDVAYDTISIAAGAQVEGRLARRSALAEGVDNLLVATPAKAKPAAGEATLFSAQPTRIAAD
jgi:cytoskeletal protein CcmA (bactofilin family)